MTKPKPLKIELENLYLKYKLSYKELAKKFSVNSSTIGEWLKSYNIPIRRFGEGKIPKGVIKPTKEELERLYWEEYLSVNTLAKKIGVDERTIKSFIDRYGITYRPISQARLPKGVVKPTKENLEKMYLQEKKTTTQIAKLLTVSKKTILNWMNNYGIKRRDSKTAKFEIAGIVLPMREQLAQDYDMLSLDGISKKYKVSVQAVLTLLKKYGIRRRNSSEARKLALQKNRIKIWNKGKKLSTEHIKKISEAGKKRAENPEFRQRMRKIGLKAKPKYKNTKPEKMMKALLESENLTNGLVEQHHLIFKELGTKPDFAFPEYKVAIYVDGNYWHGGLHYIGLSLEKIKDGPRKESIKKIMKRDAKQHHTLWRNGWTPLRFWQSDIEKNPKWVIEQIKKNIYDKEHIKKREEQRKELL